MCVFTHKYITLSPRDMYTWCGLPTMLRDCLAANRNASNISLHIVHGRAMANSSGDRHVCPHVCVDTMGLPSDKYDHSVAKNTNSTVLGF